LDVTPLFAQGNDRNPEEVEVSATAFGLECDQVAALWAAPVLWDAVVVLARDLAGAEE